MYNGERHFKLNFKVHDYSQGANIEGYYVNSPFNQVLIGHFRWNDTRKQQDDVSFMISKRSLAKLSFEDDEFVDEFYVEIKNNKVIDQSKMISLKKESARGYIF